MSTGRTTLGKALAVNQDTAIYGTFAEIGAGQEVARFFFQAGQASQTIAKTISAYDMVYSDEIYGKESSGRYVCESRVQKMLEKEFSLLTRRLSKNRGERSRFFALANTVATGDQKKRFSHGWMGIRFQKNPQGEQNEIILHVRLLDKYRLQQQECLGILGVNLVHAAYFASDNGTQFVSSLVENLREGQVSIDFLRFDGPDLKHLSNQLANLELVKRGLSEAILFGPDQSIMSIGDTVFQKPIIFQRGTFRPVTTTHMDLLTKGGYQFDQDFTEESGKALVLFELTMNSLQKDGHTNEEDFLDRIRCIGELGGYTLVSNFFLHYKLKRFIRQYTEKPMILILGASHLSRLFDASYYKDLEGGILEGLGKLLDNKTRVYVYPHKTEESCMTAATYSLSGELDLIYKYFRKLNYIQDIAGCEQIEEFVHSDQIRDWIKSKNPKWEKHVPNKVKKMIQEENLFGFKKKQ